jgi:hypothetical protein
MRAGRWSSLTRALQPPAEEPRGPVTAAELHFHQLRLRAVKVLCTALQRPRPEQVAQYLSRWVSLSLSPPLLRSLAC